MFELRLVSPSWAHNPEDSKQPNISQAQHLLAGLSALHYDAIALRGSMPQHEDQLLNLSRHMSLIITDIESALVRAHFVDDILRVNDFSN